MKTYDLFIEEARVTLRESKARWERVKYSDSDRSFQTTGSNDDYFYHVTLSQYANRIISSGHLKPNVGKGMGAHQGLAFNCKGRVFLTDRNGVFFWVSRAEDHAMDNFDDDQEIVVLRIPKSAVPNAELDSIGTRDAHANAYYVEGGIRL